MSRKKSIVMQLTGLYTLASASMLTLIAVLLYWALNMMMSTAEKQYLVDEAHVIQHVLLQGSEVKSMLQQEVNGVPTSINANASYHYYVRLIDAHDQVFMETPRMHKVIPNNIFPSLTSSHWATHFGQWHPAHGKPYLLITAPVKFDSKGHVIMQMRMALDTSYPDRIIHLYGKLIALCLIMCIGVISLLGKVIAKKGLASLYELAKVTEQITVSHLSKRLDLQPWPKELTSLGHAFNTMLQGIEKAFTQLNNCTSELAHELRAPLNNIIGSGQVLLSRPRIAADYCQLLVSNVEECQRLSRLIDNVLFLARAEQPHMAIDCSVLHLDEELARICDFHQMLAQEKSIQIYYQSQDTLYADPMLFQRVINNLLVNAISYTPFGSTIWVSSQHVGNTLHIIVKDNGQGIDQAHLPHLFERFYRGKNHTIVGAGLGLALIKSIMELHKGSVTLDSKVGIGTCVTLIFPHTF